MSVYLLRAGDTDRVKIGYAIDVIARMAELQAGCWESLNLLRTWPGHRTEEAWMHQRFDEHRIAREWFQFCPEMLSIDIQIEPVLLKAVSPFGPDPVLSDIEKFLDAAPMTATMFGRLALNDPTLVHELKRGRECRRATRTRIRQFIQSFADGVQPQPDEAA